MGEWRQEPVVRIVLAEYTIRLDDLRFRMRQHPLITALIVIAVVVVLGWIASHPAPVTP